MQTQGAGSVPEYIIRTTRTPPKGFPFTGNKQMITFSADSNSNNVCFLIQSITIIIVIAIITIAQMSVLVRIGFPPRLLDSGADGDNMTVTFKIKLVMIMMVLLPIMIVMVLLPIMIMMVLLLIMIMVVMILIMILLRMETT